MTKTGKILRGLLLAVLLPLLCGCGAKKASTEFFAMDTVMQLTDKFVRASKITTMMVTHNLRFAVEYGTRLIMMHEGKCIVDIRGEEKKKANVDDLLNIFYEISIEVGN